MIRYYAVSPSNDFEIPILQVSKSVSFEQAQEEITKSEIDNITHRQYEFDRIEAIDD